MRHLCVRRACRGYIYIRRRYPDRYSSIYGERHYSLHASATWTLLEGEMHIDSTWLQGGPGSRYYKQTQSRSRSRDEDLPGTGVLPSCG